LEPDAVARRHPRRRDRVRSSRSRGARNRRVRRLSLPLRGRPDAVATGAIAVVAACVFAFWARTDAGFDPVVWAEGGLLLLVVLGFALAYRPELLRDVPRTTIVAIAALAAFAVWSLASILWADSRADAWDGGNRVLVYLVVYALFALWPWRPTGAAAALGMFSVGVTLVGVATLVGAAWGDAPGDALIAGLLAEPAGYHNANAALFLLAFWPAVYLASRAEARWARPLLLAVAVADLQLALLSQSRGATVVFPVALLVYFAIVPGRVRSLTALVPAALVAAVTAPTMLDVYPAADTAGLPSALQDAVFAIVAGVAVAAAVGVLLVVLESRVRISPERVRTVGVVALAAVALAALAGAALAVRAHPVRVAQDAWSEFTEVYETGATGDESHLSSGVGSNRYDFWRVALNEFADAPFAGIGADNFAIPYLRERRSVEEPLYPHSLQVQVLSQTGIVGAGLFVAFVVAAVAAAAQARGDRRAWGLAAVGIVAATYWLGHASGDWLWEIPGVGAPALAALGLGAGLARREPERGRAGRPLVALAVLAGLAVAVSLVPPWLSAQQVDAATRTWRDDPAGAYATLGRARRLNPLSPRPDLVEGAIASRRGEWDRMRSAFGRALGRSPGSWYAELELGVVEAVTGRRREALRHLERARTLNPREPAIAFVRDRVEAGRPVDPRDVDRLFVRRVEGITR
jgi:O-antigen ligase